MKRYLQMAEEALELLRKIHRELGACRRELSEIRLILARSRR